MSAKNSAAESKISLEQVRHVARLARLELEPAEEQSLQANMSEILSYIDQLNQLDTSAIPPTAQVGEAGTPTRDDVVTNRPAPDDMLAVAGGYAYLVNTTLPELCVHLPLRPVTQIVSAVDEGLVLLAGFHTVAAIGATGLLWETAKLSWEGVTLSEIRDGKLSGEGWNMQTDREVPFSIDLRTGAHEGGGFGSV